MALGSNLDSKHGNRKKNLELAQFYLKQSGIKILNISSYYESLSYPNISDPKFINCVLTVYTHLKPIKLMQLLINIEEKLGRIRNKKNEPRVCDIDIIDYKKEIIIKTSNNLNLIIPHKKIEERNFVLIPLKEIEPLWTHPKTNLSVDKLISNLKPNKINDITKI